VPPNLEETPVPDKKLAALAALIIALSFGHDIDHTVRGDFRWQPNGETLAIYAVLLAKYTVLGCGLYLDLKSKSGPLFWAIVAGISVVLGFLAHFSPFSDQTPQVIYRAYATPAAGALAVLVLALLMLTLVATAVYAQYLRAKGWKSADKKI
jgi:hypothetical protein